MAREKQGGGEKQRMAAGGKTRVEGSALCQENSNKLDGMETMEVDK